MPLIKIGIWLQSSPSVCASNVSLFSIVFDILIEQINWLEWILLVLSGSSEMPQICKFESGSGRCGARTHRGELCGTHVCARTQCSRRILDETVRLCEQHRTEGECSTCFARPGFWQMVDIRTSRGLWDARPARLCEECTSPANLHLIDAQTEAPLF